MATTSPPHPVAVLDSAVTWAHGCLQPARDQPLDLPTPCRDWDLGRLLRHMDDSLAAMGEAAELGHVSVDAHLGRPGAGELVDRLVQRACRTRAAWHARVTSAPVSVGGLALGRDTLLRVGALEVAVHAWDVRTACGDARPVPEDLAVRLLDVALAVVTPEDRPRRFAAAVPAPPGASASTRLLGHLGRTAP